MLSRQACPERCRRATGETNPKFEYRNPKQTQSQIKLKSGKIQNTESEGSWFRIFCSSRLCVPSTSLRACFGRDMVFSMSYLFQIFKYVRLDLDTKHYDSK